MAYGFRVFSVTATKRGDENPLDISVPRSGSPDAKSSVLPDQIGDAFARLQAMGTQYGTPQLRVTAEAEDGLEVDPLEDQAKPSFSVQQPTWVSPHHLHVALTTGTVGMHRQYVEEGMTEPQDVRRGSAEVAHRLDFLFPVDEGDTALLVVETVASSDPHRRVRNFLVHTMHEHFKSLEEANRKAREAARASSDQLPPTVRFPRATWRFRQLEDGAHLLAILREAQSAAVVFEEYVPSARGGSSERRRGVMTLNLLEAHELGRAVATIRRWLRIRGEQRGRTPQRADVLYELAEEFDVNLDNLNSAAGLSPDRAALSISNGHDTRTITPESLRETFTYPVSRNSPAMSVYYARVIPKVEELARQWGIELEDLDPEVVTECLADSTSGRSDGA